MSLAPREGESLDHLVNGWRIFQLVRGHRFSTDDLVVTWRATKAMPHAKRLLDIGCGIGSVGLSTLSHLDPSATMVGVEAQALSVGLARRTIEYNGLADRVRIVNADLRDPDVLPEGSQFDLITGSPPYIPEGKGVLSPIPQRAAARIELRIDHRLLPGGPPLVGAGGTLLLRHGERRPANGGGTSECRIRRP